MVKWLRELAASSEDLVLLLAPTWELTTVLNSSLRRSPELFWPPQVVGAALKVAIFSLWPHGVEDASNSQGSLL